jgi:hypothetical protein
MIRPTLSLMFVAGIVLLVMICYLPLQLIVKMIVWYLST